MRPFHARSLRILFIAVAWAFLPCLLTLAQDPGRFDLPLPSGSPTVIEGQTYSSATAFSVSGQGRILDAEGIPHAPSFNLLVPDGPLAMVTRWYELSARKALYRSVGNDRTPDTADDELIMVCGLPGNAHLVPTAIFGQRADSLPLSETAAVLVDATNDCFHVLHHVGERAWLQTHLSARALIDDPRFSWGLTPAGTLFGMVPGPDGTLGSLDDEVLVVEGLDGSAPVQNVHPSPVVEPAGLAVTDEGIGVAWRDNGLVGLRLATLVPAGQALVSRSLKVTLSLNPSPAFRSPRGCLPGEGGTIVVWGEDDLGPGRASCVVGDLVRAPRVLGAWYDDFNGGWETRILSEGEIVRYSAMGPTWFSLERVQEGIRPAAFFAFTWGSRPDFQRPRSDLLACFSTLPDGITGRPVARALFVRTPWDGSSTSVVEEPGSWAGCGVGSTGESWPVRTLELGKGRLATFIRPTSSIGPPTLILRLFTLPGILLQGPGVTNTSNPLHLHLAPDETALGRILAGVSHSKETILDSALILSTEARESGPLPAPLFANGARLHLDIKDAFFLPMPAGTRTRRVDFSQVRPFVAGRAFHVQLLALVESGQLELSPSFVVYPR